MKKEDLRIRKTKANLYKGLLELMETMSFEDIKVTDICNKALINRSTFYDHFNDKFELLSSLMTDLKQEITIHLSSSKNKSPNNLKEYYLNIVKELIYYVEKNLNTYSTLAIIKKNNNSIAYDMMFDAALESVSKEINQNYINTSNIPTETIALFYVSGVTKVLTESIKDASHFDSERVIEYLDKLLPELDYLIPIKE